MGAFKKWVLELKKSMLWNGDWLFVTETPPKVQSVKQDLALRHDSPPKVLGSLVTNDLDSIKLIYDRAKAYESRIENIGNLTREKARTLLGTISIVTAVFFGVASFFSSSTLKYPPWAIVIELLLFLLLAAQLIHSLVIAMDVMTREVSINASVDEMLKSDDAPDSDNTPLLMLYKNAIAQMIAYSNQTHSYITDRVSKLILGQHAFRYGLVYFTALIFFHIFLSVFHVAPDTANLHGSGFGILEKNMLETVVRDQRGLRDEAEGINARVSALDVTLGPIVKRQIQLETKVREMENVLTRLQSEVQQLARDKGQVLKKPQSGSVAKKR